METINDRISQVAQVSGLTKTAFAEKLNLSQPFVSRLIRGETSPSDRTVRDICRVFNVNEAWLRTGEGEMHTPKTRSEELAEIFADVQISDDARARLVKAFAALPDEAYPQLYKWFQEMAAKLLEQDNTE